jgi:hypothetical protein
MRRGGGDEPEQLSPEQVADDAINTAGGDEIIVGSNPEVRLSMVAVLVELRSAGPSGADPGGDGGLNWTHDLSRGAALALLVAYGAVEFHFGRMRLDDLTRAQLSRTGA